MYSRKKFEFFYIQVSKLERMEKEYVSYLKDSAGKGGGAHNTEKREELLVEMQGILDSL